MKDKIEAIRKEPVKTRTLIQNRALHLMFEHLSQELNDAGLDMRKTLKPGVEIPWNKNTVKEYLWRPIQKAVTLKESTTKLDTKEIDKVFEILLRHMGNKFGVEIQFPSIETLMMEQRIRS